MARYLHLASLAGIPPKDALLLMTPGQLLELSELQARAKGLKRSDDS